MFYKFRQEKMSNKPLHCMIMMLLISVPVPVSIYRAKKREKFHENTRPHVGETTRTLIESLNWKVLAHSGFSPDLAATGYHCSGEWCITSFRKATQALEVLKN